MSPDDVTAAIKLKAAVTPLIEAGNIDEAFVLLTRWLGEDRTGADQGAAYEVAMDLLATLHSPAWAVLGQTHKIFISLPNGAIVRLKIEFIGVEKDGSAKIEFVRFGPVDPVALGPDLWIELVGPLLEAKVREIVHGRSDELDEGGDAPKTRGGGA